MMQWINESNETTIERLTAEFSITTDSALKIYNKIVNYDDTLHASFLNYWNHGKLDQDIACCGVSLETLTTGYGMTVIGAFSMIDWLKKSPEEALKSLQSNRSGFDPRKWFPQADKASVR